MKRASTVKLDASADIVGHGSEVRSRDVDKGLVCGRVTRKHLKLVPPPSLNNMNHLEDYRDEDKEEQVLNQEGKGKERAPTEEVEDDTRKRAVEQVVALRAARKMELDQLLAESEKVRSQKEKEMEKWRRQEVCIAQLSQQLASGMSLTAEEEDKVDLFHPMLVDSLCQPSPLSRRAKRRQVAALTNIGEAGLSNVVGGVTDTSDGESEGSESSDEPEENEGTKKRKWAGGSKGNVEETKKVGGQLIQVVKDRSYFIHLERQCERCLRRKIDCGTPKDNSYACLDCKRGSVKCSARTGARPVKQASGTQPRSRKGKAKVRRVPKSEADEAEGPKAESLWDSLFRLRYWHSQDREVLKAIAEGFQTVLTDKTVELWLQMAAVSCPCTFRSCPALPDASSFWFTWKRSSILLDVSIVRSLSGLSCSQYYQLNLIWLASMSYSYLPPTLDFVSQQDRNWRRQSHQFSAIVPLTAPSEMPTSDPPAAIYSRMGSAHRAQFAMVSPTESQHPGPSYPQVMDFDEYDQLSASGSRASPTLRRRSSTSQTATIYELPEDRAQELLSVPKQTSALAFPPVHPLLLLALPPAPRAKSSSAPPLQVVASGPPDGDKGNGSGRPAPDPSANPPAQPPNIPPTGPPANPPSAPGPSGNGGGGNGGGGIGGGGGGGGVPLISRANEHTGNAPILRIPSTHHLSE
ncbi:hypothetical protein C8R45DRAFT_948520 [Mycena sanguinolenta]|nr:hypothetical protein C8R45DRAFT_948520 [Mycena sanguinolenta]